MPTTRRRAVVLGLGLVGGVAGCLGRDPDRADEDHDVRLDNSHDEEHVVGLEVTHESDTIHEGRHRAPPGTNTVVYNFQRSPIDGVAEYVVAAELEDGQADSVEIRTTACYGGTVVHVDEDGDLRVFYSIC